MKKRTKAKPSRSQLPITAPDCKRFGGYKPCFPNTNCERRCAEPNPFGKRILVINLDAMGNVLVTTSILPALKRKYPTSHISWITLKNAYGLLLNNPYLDRVYVWEPESWLILQHMEFDVALNVDKSQRSGAFIQSLAAREKLGFGINRRGQVVPLNKEANYNYRLGLNDHLKFHVNQKTVQQIQCEQFKLKYRRDEYVLELTDEEKRFCESYKHRVGIQDDELVVGFNTGCSELYPNKKMTIDQHVALIESIQTWENVKVVLLGGGMDDMARNAEIAQRAGKQIVNTPTMEGVRRGLCYENMCDVVVTGDSFGMHAAIGLKKFVIAWFGVTCPQEIDLYDRGVKFIPHGLECSPCWKRSCPYNLECIAMIDLEGIVNAVRDYRNMWMRTRSLLV
jgi:heptosyltransferase-2